MAFLKLQEPSRVMKGLLLAVALTTSMAVGDFMSQAPAVKQNPTDTEASFSNPLEPAYVGVPVCAQCHPDEAGAHERSGHSHTFRSRDLAGFLQTLLTASKSFKDPERSGTITWQLDEGQLISVYQDLHEKRGLPVQFALGSGTHATTFLTLLDSEKGEPLGLEHRLSLFDGNRKMGLTPNQNRRPNEGPFDCFGKLEHGHDLVRCIECHTTTGRVIGREVLDLRPNVGCESCHGPGREHVAAMQSGRNVDDFALRYSGRKSTAREEIQLCGNCHRLPESLSTPAFRDNPKLARFQPVGLLNSLCYRRADEHLRCSTCHNPHDTVDRSTEHYVDKCRSCHRDHSLGHRICPKSADTGCIDCHMPAIEVHPGISFHDHWIRIR